VGTDRPAVAGAAGIHTRSAILAGGMPPRL